MPTTPASRAIQYGSGNGTYLLKGISYARNAFIVVIISLSFSLLGAEIILRYFVRPSESKHEFVKYDSLLGWKLIPNEQGMNITEEYKAFESVNSHGFRGPDYSYFKTNNEYRILILGDSFSEGYQVQFEDLFSETLKRELNKHNGQYYEVINTGVRGYSTDQELLLFENQAKKYRPDLTVLMFYENDVWYNSQGQYWVGAKPFFENKDDNLVAKNIPVPQFQESTVVGRLTRWLYKNSYVYKSIRDRLKIQLIGMPREFLVWQRKYSDDISQAWEITKQIILKLRSDVIANKSEFLLFYVPSALSVYDDRWEQAKRQYGISGTDWNARQSEIELREFCKRYGIYFISTVELFRLEAEKLRMENKALYFVRDGHWNVYGHRVAGEALKKYLKAKILQDEMVHDEPRT